MLANTVRSRMKDVCAFDININHINITFLRDVCACVLAMLFMLDLRSMHILLLLRSYDSPFIITIGV